MKGAKSDRINTKSSILGDVSGPTRGFVTTASIPVDRIPKPKGGRITEVKIKIDGTFTLGAMELRVMHAILGFITTRNPARVKELPEYGMESDTSTANISSAVGYKPQVNVPAVIDETFHFFSDPLVVHVTLSARDIASASGLSQSSENYKAIAAAIAALERSSVQFFITAEEDDPSHPDGKKRINFKSNASPLIKAMEVKVMALSENASPDQFKSRMLISVEPHVIRSLAIQGQHTVINLAELRALKREAAVLIHNYLCGFIDIDATVRVGLDRMIAAIYPEEKTPPNREAIKRRVKVVRAALQELREINWKVIETKGSTGIIFHITRPRNPSMGIIDISTLGSPIDCGIGI